MKSAFETINKNKMFNEGENIGIACSGGSDSICLLHFLNSNKELWHINVFAVNVNHNIRQNSINDTLFVNEFCKKNSIPLFTTEINWESLIQNTNMSSTENIARKARYNFFESLLNEKKLDKICLAHHQSDQVETILLNILRGTGLNGAGGMKVVSNNYLRPLLNTTKEEILQYISDNNLNYVTDESNYDTNYSRNFLRQNIIPMLQTKFPATLQNISQFGNKCREDNDYIECCVKNENIIYGYDFVKLPLSIFSKSESIYNRAILRAFRHLNAQIDIEEKHINLIYNIAQGQINKIDLPNNTSCVKEDNYIVIYLKNCLNNIYKFDENSTTNFNDICNIQIVKSSNIIENNTLKFDIDKLPDDLIWRKKQNGDIFTKINGKTQKLKDFLIERKIPKRNRDKLPVLAKDNIVYIVANIEICDKIKINKNTEHVFQVLIDKNFKE